LITSAAVVPRGIWLPPSTPPSPQTSAYTNDLRQRTIAHGRPADSIRVMPGLSFVLGGTETEARARNTELNELAGQQRLEWLAWQISVEPDALDSDKPLPDWVLNTKTPAAGSQGARDIELKLARRERLTLRELMDRVITWHRLVVGSPEQLADGNRRMVPGGRSRWFQPYAGRGTFGHRGVRRTCRADPSSAPALPPGDYEGTTLRDHLALSVLLACNEVIGIRAAIAEGRDPSREREAQRREPTFGDLAGAYVEPRQVA
jgi:hypothetical protein